MVGLLFHVLYLLGKCIYDRYRFRKPTVLPDVAYEEELFKRDYDYDAFDDDSELEDTLWWSHRRTIGCFYPPAYVQRYGAVMNVLNDYKGKLWKIVDYGCSELGLLVYLKTIPEVEQILCVDVDREVLERYKEKAAPLTTEMLSTRQRKLTIEICEGSVTDNDTKLKHANAVICIELIEHLYPDTLMNLPFNIFGYIKPEVVIITTPNVEFNVVFPNLSGYRHPDHKFEWTREQFQDWAQNIVVRYPYYSVTFHEICNGPEGTEEIGPLTQMAVFHRTLPRKESRLEILIPDEYIQLKGQHSLFNTVATYEYSTGHDIRSDEQKILDEATYYINYLSYNVHNEDEPRSYEINLERILYFMTKYTISMETLRSILIDAGWSIADRENGPVVLNPSVDSYDEMSSFEDDMENDWNNEYEDFEDSDFTNVENIWDYTTGPPINETGVNENERYSSEENLYIENLYEESSITNEEDRWDYVTNPVINEISADANEEYLSEQNLHTPILHDSPNVTHEGEWDYGSGINETSAYVDEEYSCTQNLHTELRNFTNVTNAMNRRDCEFDDPYINQLSDTSEEYLLAQNPHIENWHEEPSIIIPENYSINQENTYLFDGENYLAEESQLLQELYTTNDDIKQSEVRNAESLVYTEQELPSDSVPLISNEVEMKVRVTASNISAAALNNSLTSETSVNDVAVESALLQSDQINLRTMERVTSMSNFPSRMSVVRSSTSPTLYFSSEMNDSLQDFSTCYQTESSINNQCLLNSTFYQSEMATAAATNTEDSTLNVEDIPCFKESLPKRNTQDKINFSLHTPDKNQIYEDNDMTNMMSSDVSSFNNKPKYTSSPHTKIPTTHIVTKSLKYRELIPAMNSNVLLDTEEIKEIISDTDSILSKSSQESNSSVTETIKLHTTSSSSDFTDTLRHDIGFSATNSTQQNLCLENKEFSDVDNFISMELIQGTNNKEFTENSINDESSVNNIQNADASHGLSLGNESINHKDKSVHCTLAKTDVTKAHLENVISDLAQSSKQKKDLNPPTELLSSKSQSVSKYSSTDCAKEFSILRNDKFVPCKSSEDTNNIFTSVLKNEEIVSTSKDVSNVAGVNNVEVKSFSPLETPPNSWSPEIMDSGYPNSVSAQDITPEYELPSIAQDYIPDSESPSIAEAPRLGVLEPIEVENGDLANNNRDDEGNNMMAVDADDIENLQPLIDVLENDLENENDIYVVQNGFPIWLLRILDMANPLDFDIQARQNLRIPDEAAGDVNYVGQDEGFDSSSSESESDVAYNEMENDK